MGWCFYWTPKQSKCRLIWFNKGNSLFTNKYELVEMGAKVARRPSVDVTGATQKGLGPSFGELGKIAPQLCSWLCDIQYEDGTAKGRTQLQVERKGDRVRVLLKSADSGLCVEAHHESLTDALLTLELLLSSDECPWQLDPFPFAGPKKRGRN